MSRRDRQIAEFVFVVVLAVLLSALLSRSAHAQTCNGSSTLTWQPPTLNTDGTPLTNLAGFKVYWGVTTFTNTATINSANATAFVVQSLCGGLWKFVVTAFNTAGAESAASNEAVKMVPSAPSSPQIPPPTTVGGRVRTLLITRNSSLMPDVGNVPAGAPCDATQQHLVDGVAYMRVDVARVTPDPGIVLDAAWAVCR